MTEYFFASKIQFVLSISYKKKSFFYIRLINKLHPGAVPKIHTQGGPIKLRENIGLFQNAVRSYGVNDSEVFQAVDCFDKRNIQQVTVSFYQQKKNIRR
jgi:hypothetical protein